jgi:DNA repair protein RadC
VGLLEPEQEIAFFTALESEDLSYLKSIPGLGPAGQARLLATFELGKRYMQYRSCQYHSENRGLGPDYKQQNIPDLAYSALAQVPGRYRIEPKEWFGFVPFYKNQTLGGLSCVERGTRTHVNIDPVELFARLLVLRPKGFFLFHNHPSGDPEPSLEDQILTQTVDHLSHQFGVQLLGHWIVTIETDRFIRV